MLDKVSRNKNFSSLILNVFVCLNMISNQLWFKTLIFTNFSEAQMQL